MHYVIMMHESHMVCMLKTKSYDVAYDVAYNIMLNFKRDVLVIVPNKPPVIIQYVKG